MSMVYKKLLNMLALPLLVVIIGVRGTQNSTTEINQPSLDTILRSPFPLHALSKSTVDIPLATFNKILIGDKPDINALDADGFAPLHYAVMTGNLKMVIMLLKFGADPNIHDTVRDENGQLRGYTPLHYAFLLPVKFYDTIETLYESSYNTLEIISQLFNRGACGDITATGSCVTPGDLLTQDVVDFLFYHALPDNNKRLVEFLISRGADVDGYDSRGYAPLHRLLKNPNVIHFYTAMVQVLLNHGADPNLPDKARREDGSVIGYTPLQYAQLAKKINSSKAVRVIIQKLLDAGACEREVSAQ